MMPTIEKNQPIDRDEQELEVIIQLVTVLLQRSGALRRSLNPVKVAILQGAWKRKEYPQIVAELYPNRTHDEFEAKLGYLRSAGARLFDDLEKALSQAIGNAQKVSKITFRKVMSDMIRHPSIRLLIQKQLPDLAVPAELSDTSSSPSPSTNALSNAPLHYYSVASKFFGRSQEITQLTSWMENQRLIVVAGAAGIGKSALVHHVVDSLQADASRAISFFRVIPILGYSDVRSVVIDLLNCFNVPSTHSLAENLQILTKVFAEQRTLVILDGAEELSEQTDDYRLFLRALSLNPHQSCVIITSNDIWTPDQVARYRVRGLPVQILTLTSLDPGSCKKIIHQYGLQPSGWDALIERSGGNPRTLQMGSEKCRDLFGGNVQSYLALETTLYFDEETSLRQLQRLSQEEWAVVEILASQPLTIVQLIEKLQSEMSTSTVIETVHRLTRSIVQVNQKGKETTYFLPRPIARLIKSRVQPSIA